MIAPLRRRHRLTTTVLALAVPVLYGIALTGRPAEPTADALPPALAGASPAGELIHDYGALFAGQAVATRLRGAGPDRWIELEPRGPIARPEVLVYWTPETAGPADRLPQDAFLLGALAGLRPRTFAVPAGALGRDGRLVLYSLGHQEVVATAQLPAVGAPPDPPDPPAADAETEAGEAATEADP